MSAELPSVPPGQNPWSVYIATAEDLVFQKTGMGFKIRAMVAVALVAFATLLAIIYLILLIIESRDVVDGRAKGLWLFRLARRQAGTFVVANTKLNIAVWTLIVGGIMIGYLVDAYNAFGLRKSMDASATLRAVVSIPILIEGWIVSWSSLQALLLATDHHARPLLRPVLANGLFVGGGIVILIVVIVVAVLNAVVANEVWHQSQHVIALMRTNERAWTPETNVLPQLLELQPLYAELARQGAKLRQVSIAQIGILLFVPLIVIFINIGSLRLAALIRTQITFNVSQCLGDRRETRYSGGGAFENTVATARSRGKEEAMEGKIASKLTQARPSILADSFSRQELRFLATRRGSGAETRAQVRTIQKLQKARRDLVTTSCTIACAIVLILALSILVFVIYIRYDDPSQIPFPYQEAILLGIAYIFGFFITVVQLVLIYNLFSARKLGGTSSTDSISGLTTGTQPLPTRHMTSESASSVHFLSSPIPGGATSGVVPAIEWSLHPKEGSEASEKLV